MKFLGEKPLHTVLVLTERPAAWPLWMLAPVALALAGAAGLTWARAAGVPSLGWAVALGLVALGVADWAFLASLPRREVSFGAVQPPWLGLLLARWILAMLAVPAAVRWPLPAFAGLLAVQVGVWWLVMYGTTTAPFQVQTTALNLSSAKLSNPGTPLRIVQLSDLHVERLTRRDRALPDLVAGLDADLVVLTGDFLNTSYNADPRALSDLSLLLGQIHAPGGVYAVWGTAEVDRPSVLRPVLQAAGVTILEDRAIECRVGDQRLWLLGVSAERNAALDGAELCTLLAQTPPDAFRLLLYHTPDLMPLAASLGVDLYLCGHTHGGQWCLPFFGAILTSSRYWKRYEAGHYREANTDLYVSRGLGMEGFGALRARFFCPPEVVSITLWGVNGRRQAGDA